MTSQWRSEVVIIHPETETTFKTSQNPNIKEHRTEIIPIFAWCCLLFPHDAGMLVRYSRTCFVGNLMFHLWAVHDIHIYIYMYIHTCILHDIVLHYIILYHSVINIYIYINVYIYIYIMYGIYYVTKYYIIAFYITSYYSISYWHINIVLYCNT